MRVNILAFYQSLCHQCPPAQHAASLSSPIEEILLIVNGYRACQFINHVTGLYLTSEPTRVGASTDALYPLSIPLSGLSPGQRRRHRNPIGQCR